ncbi:MAG: DUF4264 family protein [Firmicutes bacterium]|jgi:hypothetical protein|nr:DUF4264 family protein [Bacillota bacterium]
MKDNWADTLVVLGRTELELEGEYPRLVTFLNKTLKDKDLIFGISRGANGRLCLTIYEVRPRLSG